MATQPQEVLCNELKVQVLAFLRKRWNFYSAAQTVGIRREQLYAWLNPKATVYDAEFAKQVDEIRDGYLDGSEENLFDQAANSKKSFVPAIFMLKSWRPERYGDRMELDVRQQVTVDLSLSAKKTLEALGAASTTQSLSSLSQPPSAEQQSITPAPQLPAHDEPQETGEQA